jgi:ATP-dependent DNA helicase RecG
MSVESRHASLVKGFWPGVRGPDGSLVHGRMTSDDKDHDHERLQIRSDPPARRNHCDRSRCRCAGRHDHGDRTCRAFRAGTAAPAAGAASAEATGASSCILLYHGPWAKLLARACQVLRESEDGFASPRRISSCAVKVKSWAPVNRACPVSGWPICRPTQICWRSLAADARNVLESDPARLSPRGAGAQNAALSHAQRRGDQVPAVQVDPVTPHAGLDLTSVLS